MRRPLLAVLVLCSCLADVDEDVEQGPITDAAEQEPITDAPLPIVKGPCASACASILLGACDWVEQCIDGWPFVAFCGGVGLTCTAAEIAAADGGAFGVEYCYRDCANLK